MAALQTESKITALYERLSRDEDQIGDSNSIVNQKKYLESYAEQRGYTNIRHYTDATDIIGLKQNPTHGRRFSPILLFIRAFCGAKRKMLL